MDLEQQAHEDPQAVNQPKVDDAGEKTKITSSVVQVEIMGVSGTIEGKIDTGAAQSSLHAEEIEIVGDRVSFVFNGNRYRTTMKTSQEVSSADGGQQSRPVIVVSLTISGKTLPEVEINLNDRSGMPQPFLIGQDVIKAADFVIDISDEPADKEAGIAADTPNSDVKPEQEEAPSGVPNAAVVSSQSIAQLGDNPLAHREDQDNAEGDKGITLLDVKTQLEELLSKVEILLQKQGQ